MSKVDWGKIKHEYITDPESSQRKIMKKYHVSQGSFQKRATREKWYELKKKHQAKVVADAVARTGREQTRMLADEADFLAMMKTHVRKLLKDDQQFNRHLVQVSSFSPEDGQMTTTEERIFDKADSKAMKDTMQVIEMIERMTRSLENIQKIDNIQRHEIELARLQLERERFEFEKQKAEFSRPDTSNTIRIDGMEKEWSE